MLKAYALVPEAYRQRFRNLRRRPEQTHVEFAHELNLQCKGRCTASDLSDYDELFNLVVLEQFVNSLQFVNSWQIIMNLLMKPA